MVLEYNPLHCLPSSEELPDSDDTPVDNELQDLIPGLLKAILAIIWANRWDWFFGVDMGVYYDPDQPAIVPDGFLSLGVQRFIDVSEASPKEMDLRLSYVLWEEHVVPILVLEVVSQKYRGEYSTKKEMYRNFGVLYYVVYNPRRRKKPPLEVYRLVNEKYVLQAENQVWLPEIGLGIGRERGTYQGMTREWLYWYDEQGTRLLTPEERIQEAEQRRQEAEQRRQEAEQRRQEAEQLVQQERQKAQRLAEQLRALGIDPDSF